ncbi:MAG TPA: MFS transporter [Gemmatimonadaceae bacterium]|jgi:predicted MFS family arabinose efflux permease
MHEEHRGISRSLTILFAVAGGVAVGNLYWAQPLLANIARSLGVTAATAGLLVTVTQVGYGAGVFLIVPLGDSLNRQRLIPAMLVLSTIALAACALAPSFGVLLLALGAVGLTTITGQLLLPLAGDLARNDQRGRVVGIVASGVLTGILASRTVSGIVADALGWRSIYVFAAVMTALMTVLLGRALPELPPRRRVPYARLLRSVFACVKEHRTVRVTLLISGSVFAVFTMFWTGLTFLLSAPPFSWSASRIGLMGIAGLAGAIGAQRAGRLHDHGWSVPATGGALVLALVSLVIAGVGEHSIVAVIVAVVLLDMAIQTVNVLNQTRLFAVDPNARSRLNTALMTNNFIGGAIGSALASALWQHGGWRAMMLGGGVLVAFALVVWLTQRKGALVVGSTHHP